MGNTVSSFFSSKKDNDVSFRELYGSPEELRSDINALKSALEGEYDAYLSAISPDSWEEGLAPRLVELVQYVIEANTTNECGLLKEEGACDEFSDLSTCGEVFFHRAFYAKCQQCCVVSGGALCLGCLIHSPCRRHDYCYCFEEAKGGGSGFCDCGDVNAWKKESFCPRHAHSTATTECPVSEKEEEELRWKRVILNFIVELLSAEALNLIRMKTNLPLSMANFEEGPLPSYCMTLNHILLNVTSTRLQNCIVERFRSSLFPRHSNPCGGPLVAFYHEHRMVSCFEPIFLLPMVNDGALEPLLSPLTLRFVHTTSFRLLCAAASVKYVVPTMSMLMVVARTLNAEVSSGLSAHPNFLMDFSDHPEWKHETMVHRAIRSTLLFLAENASSKLPTFQGSKYLFPIDQSRLVRLQKLHYVICVIECGPDPLMGLVLSGCAFRAYLMTLEELAVSNYHRLCEGLDNFFMSESSSFFMSCGSTQSLQLVFKKIYDIARCINHCGCYTDITGRFGADPLLIEELRQIDGLSPTSNFFVGSDGTDFTPGPYFFEMIKHTKVTRSILLPDEQQLADKTIPEGSVQLEYILTVGDVIMRSVLSFLDVQEKDFRKENDTVVLSSLNEEQCASVMAFDLLAPFLHAVSLFNLVVVSLARLLRICVMLQNSPAASSRGTPPVNAVLSKLLTRASVTRADFYEQGLLDSVVMPFVLLCQHKERIWHQNEYNLDYHSEAFCVSTANVFPRNYVLLLQVLCAEQYPSDFTLRIWQRFSYARKKEHTAPSAFLKLILTMQLSVSDLKTVPDYEKEFITHRIAMYIAAEDMTFPQMLKATVGEMFLISYNESEDRFLGVDWASILQEALEEIAVPWEVKDTKCHLIKDDTTWVKYVNLYSASPYELNLDTLHERYNLVRRRAEPTKPNSTPYCLPPPQFNASHVPAESLRPLRLLLHTDAVVIPAVHLLHQKYLEVRGDRSEDAPTSAVDPATVLHAITVLYLAVQDSLEVYHAQCRTEGGPIGDWKVVEDYLAGKEIHRSAFTEESVSGYCPLPELRHASSIKERLVRNITESASSTAEVLAGLRLYYKSNPSLDKFSYVRMIEFILTQTSLADFEEDCSEGDQTAAGPNEEEARLQRIKAKQREMMRRLRKRYETEEEGEDASLGKADFTARAGQDNINTLLFTRMLSNVSESNCCVCLLESDQPLLLFASRSESLVLSQLGFVDGSAVTHHFSLCGHAAHYQCIQRFHRRNNLQAASVFRCPLCASVMNAVCALPCFDTEGKEDSTMFEMLQNGTPKAHDGVHGSWLIEGQQYPRLIHDRIILLLEQVKVGHHLVMNDLLAITALLTNCPAEGNDEDGEPGYHSLIMECLRCPAKASAALKTHALMRLSGVQRSVVSRNERAREEWRDLRDAKSIDTLDDDGKGSSLFLVSLWTNLGFLALLKMVLSDSSLNQVLTVGESGDVVQCTPLEPSVLSNRTSLIGSVRVLMGYLLEEEYSRPLDQPAGQLPLSFTYQRLEELSLMYTGAEAWGCTVAEHILCFPSEYLVFLYEHYRQLSACAECSALDSEKAICCYCRRAVCVDSLGAELMSHCRSCVGLGVSDTCDGQMNKLGLFLQGQRSLIISVDPQTAYFCYYPSFYLDKYGETNESLKVKNSLFRSTARVIKFLNVWLCGSWSMNPKLVKRTFSKPVSFLSA